MTLDELGDKMERRFDVLDNKVDTMAATVAVHTTTLNVHDRENKDLKERVNKLERWMWVNIGAGLASGATVAKLFL